MLAITDVIASTLQNITVNILFRNILLRLFCALAYLPNPLFVVVIWRNVDSSRLTAS